MPANGQEDGYEMNIYALHIYYAGHRKTFAGLIVKCEQGILCI